MKIHCGSPLVFTQFPVLFECLWSLFLSLTVSTGVQAQILGAQMEGTSLPPAFYLDISIDSHLQIDFLPFSSLGLLKLLIFL